MQKGGRFYLDFTLGELQRIAQLISAAPNKISELAFAEMGHGGKGAKKKG